MERTVEKLLKGLSLQEIEEIVLGNTTEQKILGPQIYVKNIN